MSAPKTQDQRGIYVDLEGVWFYEGREMFRRDIVRFFCDHLEQGEDGRYCIVLPGDRCDLAVADTVFVVRSVDATGRESGDGESVVLHLSDDSEEPLDPETLFLAETHVLYCRVKSGRFTARFSRPAYYQIMKNLDHDPEQDRYSLRINGRAYGLGQEPALPAAEL